MTPNELDELEKGKKWFGEIISKSKQTLTPKSFNDLQRRLQQIKCNQLLFDYPQEKFINTTSRYFLGLGFITWLLIKSRFSQNKIGQSFSIWDSDIDSHTSLDNFIQFIDSKQIVDLDSEHFIFVKSTKHKIDHEKMSFLPNPIYNIISYLEISILDSLKVTFKIAKNYFRFLKLSLHSPDSQAVFKDFLTEPLILLFQKMGMLRFYRTNSHIPTQEFWVEKINYNTIWYSTNSRANQYYNTPDTPTYEYPLFYFMHFGTSWTWNESNATWLKSFQNHPVKVVGPILFYCPPLIKKQIRLKKRVLIFDVTPTSDSFYRHHQSQYGFNYYNEKCCINFIAGIFEAMIGKDWEICLKPKRKYNNHHSQDYINYLNQLEKFNPNFIRLPPQSNIYDEIQKSHLVITIPFSSPFEIAKLMNTPSIYFDPSGYIDCIKMGIKKEEFCSDISSLKEVIDLI